MLLAQRRLAMAEALHQTSAAQERSPKPSNKPKRAAAPRVPTPPPGLEFPGVRPMESPLPPPGLELPVPIAAIGASVDGITTDMVAFEGRETTKVSWRVSRFAQQLVGAMGRPLVSPCLESGLSDTWIMVEPCVEIRGKEQKERFRRRVRSGPLDCRVKVKLAEAQRIQRLLCRVTIGSRAFEVFSHDFADEPLLVWQQADFDWSNEVSTDDSIEIGIEFAMVERVA